VPLAEAQLTQIVKTDSRLPRNRVRKPPLSTGDSRSAGRCHRESRRDRGNLRVAGPRAGPYQIGCRPANLPPRAKRAAAIVALLAVEAGQTTAQESTFGDRRRFVAVKAGKTGRISRSTGVGTREELFELISCGPASSQRSLHGWRHHDEASIRRRSTDVLWAFQDWSSAREWDRARDREAPTRHARFNDPPARC